MPKPNFWASRVAEPLGAHELVQVEVRDSDVNAAVRMAAKIVPRHYVSGPDLAAVLRDLGKPAAADFIEGKLPTTKKLRSGELGEILGTHYVTSVLGFRMIARLRWKDSRNMAMRGDDIVGIQEDGSGQIHFLKGEAKSRAILSMAVLKEAQSALFQHRGRPAPHTLSFISSRLRESGEHKLANRILESTLTRSIPSGNVKHLIFTFSGNNSTSLLKRHTAAYTGKFSRMAVGVFTANHQEFIKKVYAKVIRDARTR